MFNDKEIEELVKQQDIDQKKEDSKVLKMSQNLSSVEDPSRKSIKDPMKNSMKDLVKGVLQLINDQKQGNLEVIVPEPPSLPK
jgi:hypothetical protein